MGLVIRIVAFVLLIALNAALAAWFVNDVPVLTDLSYGQWLSVVLTVWTTWTFIDVYKEIEAETRD